MKRSENRFTDWGEASRTCCTERQHLLTELTVWGKK